MKDVRDKTNRMKEGEQNADTSRDAEAFTGAGALLGSSSISALFPSGGRFGAQSDLTPFNPKEDLAMLRHNFPFLPILPYPTKTLTLTLAANVARDFNFPSEIVMAWLRCPGNFYACINGNAEIPTLANEAVCMSVFKPTEYPLYIGSANSISVISDMAITVQAMCWAREQVMGK